MSIEILQYANTAHGSKAAAEWGGGGEEGARSGKLQYCITNRGQPKAQYLYKIQIQIQIQQNPILYNNSFRAQYWYEIQMKIRICTYSYIQIKLQIKSSLRLN